MIDKDRLCEFLVEAKKATYAAGDSSEKIIENDKSKTLIFEKGDLKYHDNYRGGEPFGGREFVSLKNEPVYIMVYYGGVKPTVEDFKRVGKFLQEALSLIPLDKPFRGPKEYKKDTLIYINDFIGEIYNFSGEEKIIENGETIYSAKYAGGFVDQRKD